MIVVAFFAFQENCEKTGEKPERMTQKDAAMFPIIASCALFGIYVVFKVSKNLNVAQHKLETLCYSWLIEFQFLEISYFISLII